MQEHEHYSVEYLDGKLGDRFFHALWVPQSPSFVVLGATHDQKGLLRLHTLQPDSTHSILSTVPAAGGSPFKCGLFLGGEHRILALGGVDGALSFADGGSGRILRRCGGAGGVMHALSGVSGGGGGGGEHELWSASSDGRVRLWDARTGDCALELPVDGDPELWSVSRIDEHAVAAGGRDGEVRVGDRRRGAAGRWARARVGALSGGVSALTAAGGALWAGGVGEEVRRLVPEDGGWREEESARRDLRNRGTVWSLPKRCRAAGAREDVLAVCGEGSIFSLTENRVVAQFEQVPILHLDLHPQKESFGLVCHLQGISLLNEMFSA